MTDYRKLMDKPYLGHWDLPEGRDVAATIVKVEAGKVGHGRQEQKRPLLYLEGSKGPLEKPMICNATNAKAIAGMYGAHVEKWIGQPIALFIGQANDPSGGGMVNCIRIRPTPPKAEKDGAK
mgnify:FL=1